MQGEQFQKLVEATKDRITGVPGVTQDALMPMDTPGIEPIIFRDIKRVVAEVENQTKLALFPRRKTDLPKTAQEAYEDKLKYSRFGCFPDSATLQYPTWNDLTSQQKSYYGGDASLYKSGSLDWDLMTREQKNYFSKRVVFVPNKSGNAERFDGKGRTYIKLYNREVIKVHQATVEIPNPSNAMLPLSSRSYSESEMIVYHKEGAITLMPSMGMLSMLVGNSAYMADAAVTYGLGLPRMPQTLKVDYTYGLEEIPEDLIMAVALKSAIKVFETVNAMFTKGLTSYAVQGFSTSWGRGMYADVIDRYESRAQQILDRYQFINLTAW